jgi:hypothetical protein
MVTRNKLFISFYRFCCVIFCFVFVSLFAASDEEFFLRGNKHYIAKEYDDAFAAYDMISKKGRAVLYNMGNCLFYQSDYPRAIVFWSRAQVGATVDEYNLIMRNKEIALSKLGKQKEKSWWHVIMQWVRAQLLRVSLLFLQLFFLIFFWIYILVIRKKQTGSKISVQSVFYMSIFLFLFPVAEYYKKQNLPCAIVVKKDAKLLAGPDKSFQVLFPVEYADFGWVKETREGWHKIQYADMIGWVETDVIQII